MSRIVLTPGLDALVLKSAGVIAGTKAKAEKVAEEAKAIAPVETGAFRDSIHVEQEGVEVAVGADVPYAVYVEYGTEDTPAFAVLRRAAESA